MAKAAKKVKKSPAKKVVSKKPVKKSAKKAEKNLGLAVGKAIPNFSIPSTAGGEFSLNDYRGKKIVLYFYPKDATPGCTVEGIEFSAARKDFEKKNTVVFGISKDNIKSHEKFIDKQKFNFHLLSDENETACKIFDVIHEKNMYGKKMMGIVRSTFLIDENGKLLKEWRKVKPEGHAKEVLQSV